MKFINGAMGKIDVTPGARLEIVQPHDGLVYEPNQ